MKLPEYTPHVQSYCFFCDRECLDYLMQTPLFERWYTTKIEVILHQEIEMSTLVLKHGWNINCLIPEHQHLDYRNQRTIEKHIIGDVLWTQNELGRTVHPYETIFYKTDRGIGQAEFDTLSQRRLVPSDMCYLIPQNNLARVKIAICFHFGYGHMYPDFEEYLKNVFQTGHLVDLYVTYQKKSDPVNLIRQQYPQAVLIQTTRGCDTGAFLVQMEHIYNTGKTYDYIFKIHTKRREDWRHELLDAIAGSSDIVNRVCRVFNTEPQVGMITGSQKWILHPDKINEPTIGEIIKRLHLSVDSQSTFVAGTIFWVRWSILKQFIETSMINLKHEYNRCELGYLINNKPTYMHSWERLFGYLVHHFHHQLVSMSNLPKDKKLGTFAGQDRQDRQDRHLIKKVCYGLSEKESKDITESIRKNATCIDFKTVNTNRQWGDPYPEKRKRLFVYLKDGSVACYNEYNAYLIPNNHQIAVEQQNLWLQLKPETNAERYPLCRQHPRHGVFFLTYFDWKYYCQKCCLNSSYDSALEHYILHGHKRHVSTFEPEIDLLKKYQIQFLAYWKPIGPTGNQIEKLHYSGFDGWCLRHDVSTREFESSLLKETNSRFVYCFQLEEIGQIEQWSTHFTYLTQFFNDPRYCKIHEQPIVVMLDTLLTEIVHKTWNQLAINAGFKGIFWIVQTRTENVSLPITMTSGASNSNYSQVTHEVNNYTYTALTSFREVYVGSQEKCHHWTPKTVGNALRGQIENTIAHPNPQTINNFIFVRSWDEVNRPQVIEKIHEVITEYHHPQIHNKRPDLILGVS
jgi:hypothetical protein